MRAEGGQDVLGQSGLTPGPLGDPVDGVAGEPVPPQPAAAPSDQQSGRVIAVFRLTWFLACSVTGVGHDAGIPRSRQVWDVRLDPGPPARLRPALISETPGQSPGQAEVRQ